MINEEIIKALEIKDDIYSLTGYELINKYGKDIDTFLEFLRRFSSMLRDTSVYPVMILGEYSKIDGFLYRSYRFDNSEIKSYYSYIYDKIGTNLNRNYDHDDIGQADYIFKRIVGYNKLRKENKTSREIIKGMLECANTLSSDGSISKSEIINYLTKKQEVKKSEIIAKSVDDFPRTSSHINRYEKNESLGRSVPQFKILDYNAAYNKYKRINPKIALCYNMNFLFLANYMMSCYSEYCDEEFLNLVKEVIEISISFDELKPCKFEKDDYLRIAKFTLKNISKLVEKDKVKAKKSKTEK